MKKLNVLFASLFLSLISFGQTNHTGTISSNEAWFVADNPHVITGNVTVADGVTLLIEPGCEIYFNLNRQLTVNGVLSANGTMANPITFTSNQFIANPGDWRYIYFDGADAGSILNYCNISYGGAATGMILVRNSTDNVVISNCSISNSGSLGIRSQNAAGNPAISDCDFSSNAGYPIYTYANNISNITGTNSFSGNNPDAIYVLSQTVNTGTWLNHGVPYIIAGNITVADAQTLGIAAGNTLKFNGNYYLRVLGALIADGDAGVDQITFTSNQPVPVPGNWNRLLFNTADLGSVLDYCIVEYAGSASSAVDVTTSGSNISISNCTIRYSGAIGFYNRGNSTTFLSNTTIENCASYPVSTESNQVLNISGAMVFDPSNTPNEIWVQGEALLTSGTFVNWGIPYILGNANLTINDGITLTIDPGTNVKIDGNRQIQVLGRLIADGDISNPITFTSNALTPAPGNWTNILFNGADSGSILDYCTLNYGGSANGSIYSTNSGSNVTISNCTILNSATFGVNFTNTSNGAISNSTIQNCAGYAIRTYGNQVKNITGTMTITGNTLNAIRVDAQAINNGTWLNHGVPYIMWADMDISDANTLTLNPGVELRFNTGARLRAYGALIADGTAADHIVFTSNQLVPAPGDWERILLDNSDAGTMFDYCDFSYGGTINGMIDIYGSGSNVTITNSTIQYSLTAGVYLRTGSTATFINNVISNNTTEGIYITGNIIPTFGSNTSEWNDIYNNGTYGLRNGTANINARYIYWGTDGCITPISDYIYDDADLASLGVVTYEPALDEFHVVLGPCATVWTGAENTLWSNPNNWTQGVPTALKNAYIPAAPTNQPIILLAAAFANDLTIEPGANLQVFTGVSLTLSGDLFMEADGSGSASLVEQSNVSIGGTATVQFYITPSRWHFISTPMTGQTAMPFLGMYLKYYDFFGEQWEYVVDENTPLNIGEGYEVWSPSTSTTVSFTGGTLNAGTYNLPVYYGNSVGNFNFVGNPYPSAIDWDLIGWVKYNIGGSVYVWDGTQYLSWNGSTGDLVDGVIPALQAFMVVTTGTSPVLAVTNNARTIGPEPYKESGISDLLKLSVSGNGYDDHLFVNFQEAASAQFDPEFDAFKIYGLQEAPQFYTLAGKDLLKINVLPQFNKNVVVPAGLEVGAETEYTILASGLTSFNEGISVFLEDKKNGSLTELTEGSTYTFKASPTDDPSRFNIHFKSGLGADDPATLEAISIYSYGKSVYVKNTEAMSPGVIAIYNMTGQKVFEQNLEGAYINRVDLNLKSGYYVVKVNSNGQVSSEKVFID